METTDFYCDKCGYNSYIKATIDSMGFEIICPHCKTIWWFAASNEGKEKQQAEPTSP